MKKIMREDDLTQPRGVHLPESPPLEPSRKALELGLAETLGQDLLHELLLIGDAERSARGEPRDGMTTFLAVQYRVELLSKVWLATTARGSDSRVELRLHHGGVVAGRDGRGWMSLIPDGKYRDCGGSGCGHHGGNSARCARRCRTGSFRRIEVSHGLAAALLAENGEIDGAIATSYTIRKSLVHGCRGGHQGHGRAASCSDGRDEVGVRQIGIACIEQRRQRHRWAQRNRGSAFSLISLRGRFGQGIDTGRIHDHVAGFVGCDYGGVYFFLGDNES